VNVSHDGADGLDLALRGEFDLFILDVLVPRIDGFRILEEIRRNGVTTPVLMLTVKDQIEDKVRGLDSGADDYLTKPFATPELLARVRTLLRRTSDNKSSVLSVDDLEVDTNTHIVTSGGVPVNLTAKEYAILEFLLYNKNHVLSRLSIAEHVWGDNFDLFTMTNFVDVHIKNLRKKLKEDKSRKTIQTVRGLGYMIKD
jgi:DNA-binding response OmpR family regulator